MSLPPLLKWAGGKRWLAPRIKEMYEPHRSLRLVEPFCGGLAVALELQPVDALLNDINGHLIHFYDRVICDYFEIDPGENTEENYYLTRDRFNNNPVYCHQSAVDFYYLNHTCFNGLCRFNKKGKFNVGYGKYENPRLTVDLKPYKKVMYDWEFRDGDYAEVYPDELDDRDFLFVDPPYDDGFTGYSGNTFGWQQQVELVDWLDRCPKVPQVATNKASDRILELYQSRGWSIELVDAPRRISCNGDRNSAKEMLATRYL